MKKRILYYLIILALQVSVANAQVWNTVSSGVNNNPWVGAHVYGLKTFDDTLFIGGGFDTLCGMSGLGSGAWDGANCYIKGILYGQQAECYEIHNGELYMGGGFFSINGNPAVRLVAKYNGGDWDSVKTGVFSNLVYCLQSYNGDLYAGGHIGGIVSPNLRRIARWDGNQWNALGTGMNGGVTIVFCMAVYHNELYIGGEFFGANGVLSPYIIKWDGTNFTNVGGGTDAAVFAMVVDSVNDRLIVGGNFNMAGSVLTPTNVAAWDGTNWTSLGSGTIGAGRDLLVRSLAFYQGYLFAGGLYPYSVNLSGDTLNHIAMWDGNDWQPLGKGINAVTTGGGGGGGVLTMEVYKDELYVGGIFDRAGDSIAYNIARWYMPPVGLPDDKNKNHFISNAHPNPAKSSFTFNYFVPSGVNDACIEITDATGKAVLTKKLNSSYRQDSVVIEKLAIGVYFVNLLHDKNLIAVVKLVKL